MVLQARQRGNPARMTVGKRPGDRGAVDVNGMVLTSFLLSWSFRKGSQGPYVLRLP